MQIISFPSHYQLVYINLNISSFSLISYLVLFAEMQLTICQNTASPVPPPYPNPKGLYAKNHAGRQ